MGCRQWGKEGEITSPIPSRNAVKTLMETEECTGAREENMQWRLLTELRAERMSVLKLLEVAI